MTVLEKENFCRSMAALFSPPERDTFEDLCQVAFYSRFKDPMSAGVEGAAIPAGFESSLAEEAVADLQKEYTRLFAGPQKCVSLIESSYKAWTTDPACRLLFAREKGLLMGDSALHMAALFQSAGLETPEEFGACPDHLVLELEFLAVLYGAATDRGVKQFMHDHLDWIPEMKEKLMECEPHPFYRTAGEALDTFLRGEKERLEREENG